MGPDEVAVHELPGVTDAKGTPVSTGDRVRVTESSSFGEGEGVVIGALAQLNYVLDAEGELVQANTEKPIRIRVRMDNGHAGDSYTPSAGRVEKLDPENQDAPAENAEAAA